MPTVSVIIPNYNHAPFLKQRIESILNQTYQEFELILIDDCSTDESREIIESYRSNPKVSHIVYNEANSGSAFIQWNKGIALAKGDWIWIAESDDYADPTFLERMMNEVAKVPDCSLAYAATWWVDENGKKLWNNSKGTAVHVHRSEDFIRERLATNCPIANVSEAIFCRDKFRPSESYRYEQMRLCGDWFFYLLMAQQGSVVELEEPLSYYRQHTTNISSDAEHRGLTFLEGADVLEYMITHCHLRSRDYARSWGRMWARYERQYNFPPEVKKAVKHRLTRRHPKIALYHLVYSILQTNKKNYHDTQKCHTHNYLKTSPKKALSSSQILTFF